MNYEDTLKSVERSLQRLDMDYIDLVLIHQPYNEVKRQGTNVSIASH